VNETPSLFPNAGVQFTGNQTADFIIKGFLEEFEADLNQTLKECNPKIRDFIRSKTGLRLGNEKNNSSQILVQIKSDYNNRFAEIIDKKYPGLNLFEFIALRDFVEGAEKSKQFIDVNSENRKALNQVLVYAKNRIERYDIKKIAFELFRAAMTEWKISKTKTMDIMGCYFHNPAKIEIYYIPLILISKAHKLRLESVFKIVLCHELSHAYHHAGKDADYRTWEKYSETDRRISEGLAEMYTFWFVDKYLEDNKIDRRTFEILSSFHWDGSPYVSYRNWHHITSYEALRDLLYSARRNNITDYDEFMTLVLDSAYRY